MRLRKTNSKILWGIFAASLTVIPSVILLAKHDQPELPIYGSVADFILTDQNSRSFSKLDLEGELWIADFIFTRCAGQCPIMTNEMNKLQKRLPAEIRLVSFSVDPQYDKSEVLAQYAQKYGAREGRWFFLTGEDDILNRLAVSFHMNTIEDPMMHSLRFVLVDQQGMIRGYYDSTDEEAMKKLILEAKALL